MFGVSSVAEKISLLVQLEEADWKTMFPELPETEQLVSGKYTCSTIFSRFLETRHRYSISITSPLLQSQQNTGYTVHIDHVCLFCREGDGRCAREWLHGYGIPITQLTDSTYQALSSLHSWSKFCSRQSSTSPKHQKEPSPLWQEIFRYNRFYVSIWGNIFNVIQLFGFFRNITRSPTLKVGTRRLPWRHLEVFSLRLCTKINRCTGLLKHKTSYIFLFLSRWEASLTHASKWYPEKP